MSNYDVQILVNGNRCKQYHHDSKIFIEAKQGSEYSIEIKNNQSTRIMAVCSVDGLDILTGNPATEKSPGYVLNGYLSYNLDGFRVSKDKVAKFTFDVKNNSYAATKGVDMAQNAGVIGVRLFSELEKITLYPPIVIKPSYNDYPFYDWCVTTCNSNITYSTSNEVDNGNVTKSQLNELPSQLKSSTTANTFNGLCSSNQIKSKSVNFDMGTKFGKAKESRVVDVDFEVGSLIFSKNIYYASRESLIEMGIPIGNEKMVSFPKAFMEEKYATPPDGWEG